MPLEYRKFNKETNKMEYFSINPEENSEVNILTYDINGKEIYDGDIVKCHDIVGFVGYDKMDASYCIWIRNDASKTFTRHSPGNNWHEWAIIGNKTENFDILNFSREEDESIN